MKPRLLLPALPVLAVAVTGCSSGEAGAMVACERFVEQRVGAPVEHLTPLDGAAAVEGPDGFVVSSGFRSGAGLTRYSCTVVRDGDGWRLVDLSTDR